MTIEQPDLFGLEEPKPVMEPTPPADNADNKIYVPFLPGVKAEDSFQQLNSLAELARQAQKCERCRLRSGCSQVVFGEGNPQSRIVFIGEGPGQDEDIQGRPFVGKAGQLLNKILEAADFPAPRFISAMWLSAALPAIVYPTRMRLKSALNGWRRKYGYLNRRLLSAWALWPVRWSSIQMRKYQRFGVTGLTARVYELWLRFTPRPFCVMKPINGLPGKTSNRFATCIKK